MNAFSSDDLLNFSRKPQTKKEPKKKQINPLFAECLQHFDEDDKKWIQIFENASIGHFPAHVKYDIDNNILTYNRQKYREKIKLPNDTLEATDKVVEFFQKFCHIYSDKDLAITSKKFILDVVSWKEIKSTNKKSHMVDEYAYALCKRNNLDTKEYFPRIKTKINIGLMLGNILNGNISIKGEKILNINNLLWDSAHSYFYVDRNEACEARDNKTGAKKTRTNTVRGRSRKKSGSVISDESLFYVKDIESMIRTPIDLAKKVTTCCDQYIGKRSQTKLNEDIKTDLTDITDLTDSTDITDLTDLTDLTTTANT